jgi:hypothetical protein
VFEGVFSGEQLACQRVVDDGDRRAVWPIELVEIAPVWRRGICIARK